MTARRDRIRAEVRDDIKAAALRQLAEHGAGSISLSAIARQLGVSAPALYRYFGNRDELLTELVADAYRDLSHAVAEATAAADSRSRAQRVRDLAASYRGWARSQPHRYELLFRPPFPGYDAHSAPLSEASSPLMDTALRALGGAAATDTGRDPAAVTEVVRVWSRLHGMISLELGGAYAAMDVDAEELFAVEVATMAEQFGDPEPR